MTLYRFQIHVFCFEVNNTLVPDADQVAMNLRVSHFDFVATTKTLFLLSTRYDNATLHSKNLNLVRLNLSSTPNTSERSLMQQNVE